MKRLAAALCAAQRVEELDTLQKGQQARTAAPNASISPFENPFGRKVKQNRALVAYAPRTQFCFTFL